MDYPGRGATLPNAPGVSRPFNNQPNRIANNPIPNRIEDARHNILSGTRYHAEHGSRGNHSIPRVTFNVLETSHENLNVSMHIDPKYIPKGVVPMCGSFKQNLIDLFCKADTWKTVLRELVVNVGHLSTGAVVLDEMDNYIAMNHYNTHTTSSNSNIAYWIMLYDRLLPIYAAVMEGRTDVICAQKLHLRNLGVQYITCANVSSAEAFVPQVYGDHLNILTALARHNIGDWIMGKQSRPLVHDYLIALLCNLTNKPLREFEGHDVYLFPGYNGEACFGTDVAGHAFVLNMLMAFAGLIRTLRSVANDV